MLLAMMTEKPGNPFGADTFAYAGGSMLNCQGK